MAASVGPQAVEMQYISTYVRLRLDQCTLAFTKASESYYQAPLLATCVALVVCSALGYRLQRR